MNITYSNVGAAAASHNHTWSDITNHPTTLAGYGITDPVSPKTHGHDASEISSGVLDIARIPVAALERLIPVADEAAMYALTVNDVQLGDTVQREDTGVMYRVIDVSNLDNSTGYKEYVAGAASSVPWEGITGKPSTFAPSAHTHSYAGSATVGGSANSAVKLDSDAGSATHPIYFSGGKPTATTYELNASVPANAVFTDTHHQAKNVVAGTKTAVADTGVVLSNTNVFLNLIENGTVRSSHKISGTGATTVTTDASGNIIISSTDSDTKYSPGTGIDITDTTISNTGVRTVTTGSANGTISVNTNGTTSDVAVKGLGSAAYTASSDYATAGHTHAYAGASSSGGSATSAVKLDTATAGSATQPVYFTGGKPAACTYSLNKTVPSNAVFTDTHHTAKNVIADSATGTANTSEALSNGEVFLNLIENGAVRSAHRITGMGATTVTTDASGNILISSTDSDTKYSPGTGINITDTTISNAGVRAIATGETNGTISVNTNGTVEEIAVKGLGSAAYTNASAYAASGHTHNYAGSSTVGGSATSAIKLDTASAGSATQPVYFSGGKPEACTYELKKTVPADAVFTDTHHQAKLVTTNSATGKTQTTNTLSNGSVFLNVVENDAVRSSHKITGGDNVSVVTDTSGNILISAVDTKYTSLPNPYSLTIKGNGTKLDDYDGTEAVEINITPSSIGAAAASHGTHVSFSTTAPAAPGTASAGSATTVARSDHVHPLQTSVSGNAGSADKLNTAITIALTGAVTGSV